MHIAICLHVVVMGYTQREPLSTLILHRNSVTNFSSNI